MCTMHVTLEIPGKHILHEKACSWHKAHHYPLYVTHLYPLYVTHVCDCTKSRVASKFTNNQIKILTIN